MKPQRHTLLAVIAAAIATAAMWRHPSALAGSYDWRYFQTAMEAGRRSLVWFAEVPLYNPWMCGGEPQLANPQSVVGSPAFLLVALFGVAIGQKLMLLAFVALGLDGAYRLSRTLGASAIASATSSLSFGLCGWIVLHFAIGHVSFFGAALIPHLLWAYLRAKEDLRFAMAAGVVLAVILAQGGNSTAAMAGIALSIVAVVDAIVIRSARPLLVLLSSVAAGLALSAYRLFPAAEFAIVHPRHTTETDHQGVLELTRSAVTFVTSGRMGGQRYAIHEYSWRLPILAWPLAVLGLRTLRRSLVVIALPLFIVGAGIALGDAWPYGPWWLMRHLPVLRDLRVPSRYVLLAALAVALLVGAGMDRLLAWKKSVAVLALALVFVDVAVYANNVFATVFASPAPAIERGPFYQVKGHYSRMLELVYANHGVVGCDEEAPLTRAALLDEGPVPQARLEDPTAGTIRTLHASPNHLEVEVSLTRAATILFDLNWNEHWHSDVGEVQRWGPKWPADKDGGRLSVNVPMTEGRVRLHYLPRSFVAGALVTVSSLLALAIMTLLSYRARRRRS